jgi:Flp pilus assembly protein CpaB
MRYAERQRRRSFNPLAIGVMLLLLAGVVFAGLAVAGRLPWQHRVIPPPEPGMVRVWEAMRPIPPFSAVTAQYLFNPETGMAGFQDVPETQIAARRAAGKKELLTGQQGLVEILSNRVMAKSKSAGQPFEESDFLPKGTAPGPVAGVGLNKRALTLEAGKLKGIDTLQVGDHLDLLAALPVNRDTRPAAAPLLTNSKTGSSATHQTETRMVARDAVVVSPLSTRMRPISSSSLMQGTSVRQVPVQEVVLAIDRQDVAGVTDVLEMGLEMDCVARSSRPDSEDSVTPPPGKVAVPIAVRFVSAYGEIVHDDLYDVRTRDLRFAFLTPEEVKSQNIIVDASELFGRVVERDRPVGQFFRQEDLAPRGTPPGLTAGVPFGKRAFAIAADKLVGSGALRHGDHLDLMASIPLSLEKQSQGGAGWLPTGGLDAASLQMEKQAEIRVVVHDAVVVAPVGVPQVASSTTGTMAAREAESPDHSAEELVLAVSVDEVAKLAEAVSLGLKLTVASRSGVVVDPAAPPVADRPTTQEKPITEFRPLAKLGMIETMNGAKRQTYLYAGGNGAAVPNPAETAAVPAASPVVPAGATPKNAAATP